MKAYVSGINRHLIKINPLPTEKESGERYSVEYRTRELQLLIAEPIEIAKVIRRMRGGSQSFLVRGSDGRAYVAKFTGNPQGNRTLINECIAGHLLSDLNVATPDLAILRLTDSCEDREHLYFDINRQVPIVNGLHLGSKCPVDPTAVTIFDFLPRQLYSQVANVHHAGVIFAFDGWVAHVDARQFVYARNRRGQHAAALQRDRKANITAWAIDNGKCFGADWNLTESLLPIPYPTFEIFFHCDLEDSAMRGAKLIEALPAPVINSSHERIPREWFSDGDEQALTAMLESLQARQREVVASVRERLSILRSSRRLAS